MKQYFIANIQVKDPQVYEKYLQKCDLVFSKYEGRYLAVDDKVKCIEGRHEYSKTVIIEFPARRNFEEWYYSKDYQAILGYRLSGADCDSILVEGNKE